MDRPRSEVVRATPDLIAEDRRLVLLAQGGDRGAFGDLVRKYATLVRALVSTRLGRGPDAEDAAQDVFLSAFRMLPKLTDPERFAGWIATIATNRALESLRRGAVRRAQSLDALREGGEEPRSGAAGVSEPQETKEETTKMLRFVADLDERTQVVLAMRFREGMAVKDIAARLGEQPPAVAMRISRALRKLRSRMTGQDDGPDETGGQEGAS